MMAQSPDSLEIPAMVAVPASEDRKSVNGTADDAHDERIESSAPRPTRSRFPRKCKTWDTPHVAGGSDDDSGYLLVLQDDELDVSSMGASGELDYDDDNCGRRSDRSTPIRPKGGVPRRCKSQPLNLEEESNEAALQRLNNFVETNSSHANSSRPAFQKRLSNQKLNAVPRVPSRRDMFPKDAAEDGNNKDRDDHGVMSRTPSRRSLARTTSFRCTADTSLSPTDENGTADGRSLQRSGSQRFGRLTRQSSRGSGVSRLPPKSHSVGSNPRPRHKPSRFRKNEDGGSSKGGQSEEDSSGLATVIDENTSLGSSALGRKSATTIDSIGTARSDRVVLSSHASSFSTDAQAVLVTAQ